MPQAKRPEPQPWLKYIVLPLLLILFGLLVGTLVLPTPVIAPSDGLLTPTPPKFVCPATAWVNCMPGPDRPRSYQCAQEFLNWAKENCPGFKGAAF